MNPAAKFRYIGPAVVDSEITPTQIGSTWYPAAPAGTPSGIVILHFHGGAFMIGDGRTHDAGFAAKTLLDKTRLVGPVPIIVRLEPLVFGVLPQSVVPTVWVLGAAVVVGVGVARVVVRRLGEEAEAYQRGLRKKGEREGEDEKDDKEKED